MTHALNIDQISENNDRSEYPDLIGGFVPDAGGSGTCHIQNGTTGQQDQSDWIPMVENMHRSCHRYFSGSESNRVLHDRKG